MTVHGVSRGRECLRLAGVVVTLLCLASPPVARAEGPRLSIRGRVLDTKGKPASEAVVFAVCMGGLPEGPPLDCGFPGMNGRKGKAAADGTFALERLPPATYSLYAAQSDGGEQVVAEATRPGVELRADLTDFELRLQPVAAKPRTAANKDGHAPISGEVLDGAGASVAEAVVTAMLVAPPQDGTRPEKSPGFYGEVRTDARGRFTIGAPLDRPVTLVARKEGYFASATSAPLRGGNGAGALRIDRCPTVRARVLGPDGRPLSELSRQCESNYSKRVQEGLFEEAFCKEAAREEDLCFSAPGMARHPVKVSLVRGHVTELGDIRLVPQRVLSVRVTEQGTSGPIAGAMVSVEEPQPFPTYYTHPDGSLVVRDYADMALELNVKANGFLPTRVPVRKGQTEVLVAMDPGLIISGKVVGANGEPRPGWATASCAGKGGPATGNVGPEGFRLTGLGPGLCKVQVQVAAVPSFEWERWVSLKAGEPQRVDFIEPSVRNPVHVRFEGPDKARRAILFMGDLPEQLELTQLATQLNVLASSGMPELHGFRAGTSEPGGFVFRGLGPGRYTLVVRMAGGAFRAPLVVGDKEQTTTLPVPAQLTAMPF
ncbi:carboxypeptidase-like regulatory domain-containing protein [Myxococcaceae bacterium GXIMD 01537]